MDVFCDILTQNYDIIMRRYVDSLLGVNSGRDNEVCYLMNMKELKDLLNDDQKFNTVVNFLITLGLGGFIKYASVTALALVCMLCDEGTVCQCLLWHKVFYSVGLISEQGFAVIHTVDDEWEDIEISSVKSILALRDFKRAMCVEQHMLDNKWPCEE